MQYRAMLTEQDFCTYWYLSFEPNSSAVSHHFWRSKCESN